MRTFLEGDQPAHVPRRGSRKPPGVKVDVVADGGRRWIRVNTYVTRPYTSIYALTSQHRTKNSRLLAEFREIDSYMTESEDEEDEEEKPKPKRAPRKKVLSSPPNALTAKIVSEDR